jgi:hypothetical protein
MEDKKITLPSTEYFYRRAMIRSAEIKVANRRSKNVRKTSMKTLCAFAGIVVLMSFAVLSVYVLVDLFFMLLAL